MDTFCNWTGKVLNGIAGTVAVLVVVPVAVVGLGVIVGSLLCIAAVIAIVSLVAWPLRALAALLNPEYREEVFG